MKRIVFVDGENLNYALRQFDKDNGGDGDRKNLLKINYKGIINDVLEGIEHEEILFYGAKIAIKTDSENLKNKKEEIVRFQTSFINTLSKQGIKFCKVGYLRNRRREEDDSDYMIEKGVDIGMVIDMVRHFDKDKEMEIIVISADTDILPALDFLKEKGARIIYVGYEYQNIFSLQKRAYKNRVITTPIFLKNRKR